VRARSGVEGGRARERRGVVIYTYIRGILLYTACIITLRCTCELFPPRLTRPIHNGMTAAKVLPVIAPRAPPSRSNIVRPSRFSVIPVSPPRGAGIYCPELRSAGRPAVRGPHFYGPQRLIIARLVRQNWPAQSFPFGQLSGNTAINFAALGILSWILNRILIRGGIIALSRDDAPDTRLRPISYMPRIDANLSRIRKTRTRIISRIPICRSTDKVKGKAGTRAFGF